MVAPPRPPLHFARVNRTPLRARYSGNRRRVPVKSPSRSVGVNPTSLESVPAAWGTVSAPQTLAFAAKREIITRGRGRQQRVAEVLVGELPVEKEGLRPRGCDGSVLIRGLAVGEQAPPGDVAERTESVDGSPPRNDPRQSHAAMSRPRTKPLSLVT